MSAIPERVPAMLQPIEPSSVVGQAYDQIRTLILDGEMEPGDRLGQVELAERLGISRTPVREALLRLTGEGLVDTISNRGFRVADLGLEAVMRRLEIRLLLEPGIARLAAERATADGHRRPCARPSGARPRPPTPHTAHDASRLFHMSLARAAHNGDLVATLEAQWINEVGRRLLAQRASAPAWQGTDVSEHEAIAAAIEAGDGERASTLTRDHIADALHHWNQVAAGGPEVSGVDRPPTPPAYPPLADREPLLAELERLIGAGVGVVRPPPPRGAAGWTPSWSSAWPSRCPSTAATPTPPWPTRRESWTRATRPRGPCTWATWAPPAWRSACWARRWPRPTT